MNPLTPEEQKRYQELQGKFFNYQLNASELKELQTMFAKIPESLDGNVFDGNYNQTDHQFQLELKRKLDNYRIGATDKAQRIQEMANLYQMAENQLKTDRASTVANMIVRGVDVATGISQQKDSNESLANQEPPTKPADRKKSRTLRDAIMNARLRQANPLATQEAQAMQAGIEDAYQADVAMGEQASGGQSGRASQLGQAAINRRYRNIRSINPQLAQIQRQADDNLTRLAGIDAQDDSRMQLEKQRMYQQDLNMYLRAQQAAGQLGQAGRTNVRRGLGGIAKSITPLMRTYNNPYSNPYASRKSQAIPKPSKAITSASSNPPNEFPIAEYEDRMNSELGRSKYMRDMQNIPLFNTFR